MKMFRKFCGLIAAYAIILQPFVMAMSPFAAAHAGFAAEICASARSDSPAAPGGHANTDCCIAMGCGAGPGGVLPDAANVGAGRIAYRAIASLVLADLRPARPNGQPYSARAPPV